MTPEPEPQRQHGLAPALDSATGRRQKPTKFEDDDDDDVHDDIDDDDDEETLKLKLKAIEARLRLKRLQNAKIKGKGNLPRPAKEPSRQIPSATGTGKPGTENTTARADVEVAASPLRKAQPEQQQQSPTRVLLGIDKGLKAKDITLKRAPSHATRRTDRPSQRTGIARPKSPTRPSEPPRIKSFSERLAAARAEETTRAQRQEQALRARTNGFGIGKEELEDYKKRAVDIPREAEKAPAFSREQILSDKSSFDKSSFGSSSFDKPLPRSTTAPNLASCDSFGSKSSSTDAGSGGSDKASSSFEPYSCFHLSRRILPHNVLARHLSGKKTLNIKQLLRDVKSPDWTLPDVEQDIVVFGIVAAKSEPRAHKRVEPKKGQSAAAAAERGKYMVMTIADLDYSVDLFLFNTGFSRFWKLTEGTVVAILNPGVMPPPPGRHDTGRFSLTINSDADTILEIGMARDLGFCKSIKKDGQACNAWVNTRRTHFCEFHANEALRKQKSSRIEVNANGFGGQDARGKKQAGGGRKGAWDAKTKGRNNYDWETKTQWFATRSFSAADLMDGKDRIPAERQETKAILRRNIEAKEQERNMIKRLGRVDKAEAGKSQQHNQNTRREGVQQQLPQRDGGSASTGLGKDAAAKGSVLGKAQQQLWSLGLTNGREREIHLSPVKRKRAEGSQTSSMVSSAKSSAYGWGSNLSEKLSSMKNGGRLVGGGGQVAATAAAAGSSSSSSNQQGARSPVRKKTRFVTDKGIREAGRESLGTTDLALDDDDDELIIVR